MIELDPEKHGPDLCAYLDGELDADAAREIERLLDESDAARGYLDELRAVSRGLSALPRIAAPDRILQSLQAEKPRVVFAGHVRRLKLRMLDIFPQTLALAALLAFVWVAGRQFLPQAGSRVDSKAPALVDSHDVAQTPTESVALNTTEDAGRTIDKTDSPTVARVTTEAPSAAPPTARFEELAYSGGGARPAAPALAGGRGGAAGEWAEKAEPVAVRGSEVRSVDPDAPPVVNVFIATRSGEEFEAMNALLADYGVKAPPADVAQERKSVPAQRQFHQMELPSGEMEGFLAALETDAPRQVNVEVRFSPKQAELVHQMVGASAADGARSAAGGELAKDTDQAGQPVREKNGEPAAFADVMPDRPRKDDSRPQAGVAAAAPARERDRAAARRGAPAEPRSAVARESSKQENPPARPAQKRAPESQADTTAQAELESDASTRGVVTKPANPTAVTEQPAASAPQYRYSTRFRNSAEWLTRSQSRAPRAASQNTAQNVILNVVVEPPPEQPVTTAPASPTNEDRP